jgi:hypothetical protein
MGNHWAGLARVNFGLEEAHQAGVFPLRRFRQWIESFPAAIKGTRFKFSVAMLQIVLIWPSYRNLSECGDNGKLYAEPICRFLMWSDLLPIALEP